MKKLPSVFQTRDVMHHFAAGLFGQAAIARLTGVPLRAFSGLSGRPKVSESPPAEPSSTDA